MARLFITPREIDFINDTAKELVKDVIGQKIYYFQISEIKTNVHDVYEEAPEKIFETPIAIDALVKYEPQAIKTNRFGSEEYYGIEVYIQKRDLIEKGIKILEGDFFSYGTVFFEVVTAPDSNDIFGEIEYKSFITVKGKQARAGQFVSRVFGPTSEEYTDEDAVQETFIQQRGFENNRDGPTADRRNLREKGVLDEPISGPSEVSRRGISGKTGSSFYDE
tara:strand:+ start:19631 stop:20293 length:663 start_codon:yes stop_codon:yes gene_type:complete